MKPRRALLLLGHGSHLNPDSSAPVYAHAERIRATGEFDQVVEAFWKEEPSLRDALDLVDAEEVVAVPLFLAEGYFTREVLPRELGISGPVTRRSGRIIHYAPPVGTHPAMAGMIVRRAASISGLDRRAAALVIIGHGTERSPTSGDTVYALVDRIRALDQFGVVTCGFLDEEPAIDSVLAGLDAQEVVLVPFFVAEGWHTRETIPADLGLTGEVTRRGDQTIWYTPPVGTMPEMAHVVLEIAREVKGEGVDAPDRRRGPVPLARAKAAFFEWLDTAPDRHRDFLQLRLTVEGEGRYAVVPRRLRDHDPSSRHHEGENRASLAEDAADATDRGVRPRAEQLGDAPFRGDDSERSFRSRVLQLVRLNDAGEYRPLRTAPDLRTDWSLRDLDREELWQAVSIIYPAAVLHWYQAGREKLEVVDYRPWALRQTAMYAALRDLTHAEVTEVIRSTCEPCLRQRVWRIGSGEARGVPNPDVPMVPCREPCTVFATRARTVGGERGGRSDAGEDLRS